MIQDKAPAQLRLSNREVAREDGHIKLSEKGVKWQSQSSNSQLTLYCDNHSDTKELNERICFDSNLLQQYQTFTQN